MAERRGRPPIEDDSQKKEKKVMLSFTQDEYDDLKKMQMFFNHNTLTSTLLFFIQKGREAIAQEFVHIQQQR